MKPGRFGNTLSIGLHIQVMWWTQVTSNMAFKFYLTSERSLFGWCVRVCAWISAAEWGFVC